MVRELGGHDPRRCAEIFRWPLAEALAAWEARLRHQAERDYRFQILLWTVRAQAIGKKAGRPPKPPILR